MNPGIKNISYYYNGVIPLLNLAQNKSVLIVIRILSRLPLGVNFLTVSLILNSSLGSRVASNFYLLNFFLTLSFYAFLLLKGPQVFFWRQSPSKKMRKQALKVKQKAYGTNLYVNILENTLGILVRITRNISNVGWLWILLTRLWAYVLGFWVLSFSVFENPLWQLIFLILGFGTACVFFFLIIFYFQLEKWLWFYLQSLSFGSFLSFGSLLAFWKKFFVPFSKVFWITLFINFRGVGLLFFLLYFSQYTLDFIGFSFWLGVRCLFFPSYIRLFQQLRFYHAWSGRQRFFFLLILWFLGFFVFGHFSGIGFGFKLRSFTGLDAEGSFTYVVYSSPLFIVKKFLLEEDALSLYSAKCALVSNALFASGYEERRVWYFFEAIKDQIIFLLKEGDIKAAEEFFTTQLRKFKDREMLKRVRALEHIRQENARLQELLAQNQAFSYWSYVDPRSAWFWTQTVPGVLVCIGCYYVYKTTISPLITARTKSRSSKLKKSEGVVETRSARPKVEADNTTLPIGTKKELPVLEAKWSEATVEVVPKGSSVVAATGVDPNRLRREMAQTPELFQRFDKMRCNLPDRTFIKWRDRAHNLALLQNNNGTLLSPTIIKDNNLGWSGIKCFEVRSNIGYDFLSNLPKTCAWYEFLNFSTSLHVYEHSVLEILSAKLKSGYVPEVIGNLCSGVFIKYGQKLSGQQAHAFLMEHPGIIERFYKICEVVQRIADVDPELVNLAPMG